MFTTSDRLCYQPLVWKWRTAVQRDELIITIDGHRKRQRIYYSNRLLSQPGGDSSLAMLKFEDLGGIDVLTADSQCTLSMT